jgi:hypothetical protein
MVYLPTTLGEFNPNLNLKRLKIMGGVNEKLPTQRISVLLGMSKSSMLVRMMRSKIRHHRRSPRLYTSLLTIETWDLKLCQQ